MSQESCHSPDLNTVVSTPVGRGTPLSRTRLQSCVNLGSPGGTDTQQQRSIKPKRVLMDTMECEEENRTPDFRTPNLVSRPSFRDRFRPRSGTFASFSRKSSANQ